MSAAQAVQRRPRLALLKEAVAWLEGGQFAQVEAICRTLLGPAGPDIEAELLLGIAVGAQGDARQAARRLDRVARARPDHAHPCSDLAEVLGRKGDHRQAAVQYQACLDLAPDNQGLRLAFAEHLLRSGEPARAIALLNVSRPRRTGDAATHHLLGSALAELGDFAGAMTLFRRGIAIDPKPAALWSNLGMMLKIERRFDEAITAHDQAVARDPDNPQLRINRAVALLHAGRMAEAWRDYEFRLRQPGHTMLPLARLLPSLSEGIPLAGRTVLVTHEEGFGDTLHFIRYAPMLAARGARVLVRVPRALAPLMRGMDGVEAVLTSEDPLPRFDFPQFDFHCPVFSLPRVFGTTMASIPAPVPYLRADPALVARWSARLPAPSGLRVGLAWAGQARPWLAGFTALDGRRSTSLATFAPFAGVPGVRFISLQAGPRGVEAGMSPVGLTLDDPMPSVADFADTAAIIANLDLVVSVDTSVVHLAGALGKPVFLLDRYDNCWRWFSGREDSPWYPSLRIFRQERPGEWSLPVQRATDAVAALAASQRLSGAG